MFLVFWTIKTNSNWLGFQNYMLNIWKKVKEMTPRITKVKVEMEVEKVEWVPNTFMVEGWLCLRTISTVPENFLCSVGAFLVPCTICLLVCCKLRTLCAFTFLVLCGVIWQCVWILLKSNVIGAKCMQILVFMVLRAFSYRSLRNFFVNNSLWINIQVHKMELRV